MDDVDLLARDATGQARLVRSGVVSARALVDASLRRIERLDPTLNAFRVVLAAAARADADRLDAGDHRAIEGLALAGVPIAVKDDTDVAGQVTAWGSTADRPVASADAEVVARLRAAGAIVIGKTNVPELTLWPWTASARWGVTRNPWDPDRTPGGSSGGSAAAVASGMCALAVGSDGGGSVRYPAGLTGLIGLKPQRGRVPVGPEHGSAWHGLLALGPLARSVRDAALFLEVAGAATASGGRFNRAVEVVPPDRLRIGFSTAPPPGTAVRLSAAARDAVESTVALLRGQGYQVTDVDIDYRLACLWNSTVRFLKGVQHDVDAFPVPEALERRTRAVARLARLVPDRSLRTALRREADVAVSIGAAFDAVDVLLTPLCAEPAPPVAACPTAGALRSLRRANTSAWLIPFNVTGQPAIAVPAGLDGDDRPVAVQLVGRAHDEATLLALAAEIEAVRPFPRCRER